MRFPTDNFETQWNLTAGYGFGQAVSYGFHEANDINMNGGGNIELGQPVYAVADGEITSVHLHTGQNTFGKHLHLKISIDGKDYWVHYAHLNDILVAEGAKVKKGDKLGTIGNTGTTYAHLHFAIKNQPTGVDGIAKTSEDLKKWENPIEFIKKHFVNEPMVTISQKELDEIRTARDKNYNDLQTEKQNVANLTKDLQKEQQRTSDLLTQLEKLTDEDKSTTEQLIDAQRALDPYKALIAQFYGILDIPNTTSDKDAVIAMQVLKDSKVKYLKLESLTFREKVRILFGV